MSNLNKVFLMGRLTKDPELRYTPQGTAVSDVGLAVNREYTVGTERRKDTTFVDVTVWKRQAEVVCEYLKKGSPIFVEGRLSLDSWEGQDGQKRSRLRVVADNFQFVGGRDGDRPSSGEAPGRGSSAGYGGGGGRAEPGVPHQTPVSEGGGGAGAPPVNEDDIPF